MYLKDFGKIAMIANEFGGMKGLIQVHNDGRLVIQYGQMSQTIEPCDLNALLAIKSNEYREEVDQLVEKRFLDESKSWRERTLEAYIGALGSAIHMLDRLQTYYKENLKEEQPCQTAEN